nr:tegumental antigen [Hymenolepis microstoma]CDS34771.1 tegumental antigen [Hymenolepis microstoma]CUU98055.1 tegumental antigen [Hymenolepis microstoma]
MESPDCETLLRYFDELSETRVATKDFENHLLKWGFEKDTVKSYAARCDPQKTGYIKRRDLCDILDYHPNQPSFLKNVSIIETDMNQCQRESIIQIVLHGMRGADSPEAKLFRVKERIEKLFGREWSLYQAYGGFWGICQYEATSNLWFNYKGITYGVMQVPGSKATIKSSIV